MGVCAAGGCMDSEGKPACGTAKPPFDKGGFFCAADSWVDGRWVVVRRNPSTMRSHGPPPFDKGGELVVTLRFLCWVGCCNRKAKWLLQLLSNVGEGLCALPPQRRT